MNRVAATTIEEVAKTLATKRRFKPYPDYQDSGIEWLGKVPAHWKTWKVTHAFRRLGSGTTPRSESEEYYGGEVPWVTTSELRESIITDTAKKLTRHALTTYPTLRVYPSGTLLFAMYGATIGRLGILGIPATVNQACCAFSDPIRIDTLFAYYWLQMRRPVLIALSTGGGQPNLSQDDLRTVRIPAPPLDEQRAIVAFLDRETARIDELIAKKQRLIELLAEKRTALISHAVTKGLNRNAPMKDSGVDWLRRVPEHWDVSRLKNVFRFLNNMRIPISGEDRAAMPKEYPYYGASGVIDYVDDFIFDEPLILVAEDGANLYSRSTPLAFVATGQYWVNNHAHILRPKAGPILFWEAVLQTVEYDPWITGSAQPKLTKENLGEVPLPLPPLHEQIDIAALIETAAATLDPLAAKIRDAMEHLSEYRSALISAAVTGKIDVRREYIQ